MSRPNIYHYATSELTQDAFICWLLSWAEPKHEEENSDLQNVANNLISTLLAKHDFEYQEEPEDIEIRRQYNDMDVVAILDEEIALLIEDKIHSTAHSGQLDRYFKTLVKEFGEQNVYPIFFKTGDQGNYNNAITNGYKPFLREELIEVLGEGIDRGVTNDIYHDYYKYLVEMDQKVKSFEKSPVEEWTNAAWKGFFKLLQDRMGRGDWGYVSNPSGGFMGFWWAGYGENGCSKYLQIEGEKLCFKISVDDEEDFKRLRNDWYKDVKEAASEASFPVDKPDRFGYGKHMTVAIYEGDFRAIDSDSIIDVEGTLDRLEKAEEVLELALEE